MLASAHARAVLPASDYAEGATPDLHDELVKTYKKSVPARRFGTTAEVASVVETKIFKNSDLLLRCMQGDAIGPGNGNASKVAGADSDDVLSALTGNDIQMHLPWGPSHCCLAPQLGSCCCG